MFARLGKGLRYCGVGRWLEEEGEWELPAVDHRTWRALGAGRGTSRRLPAEAVEAAEAVVERLVSEHAGRTLTVGERKVRVLGRSAKGGVEIDGGPGGFAARTVSVTDFAWVIQAQKDVEEKGGVLNEERVNRLRYLEGTPKASTRWIDAGWAIALVRSVDR